MRTVVFWCDGPAAQARALHGRGAAIVLWNEESADALRAAAVPFTQASAYLPGDVADQIDAAAIAWTKAWGHRPVLGGRSFRELLAWKGVSLWWFAELYLHHSTDSTHHVRLIETFHRILEAERPDEVETSGMDEDEAVLLGRTCTSRGVLFHGPRSPSRSRLRRRLRRVLRQTRWNALKTRAAVLKAALSGRPPRPAAPERTVLFLSHAAFWRERADPATQERRVYEHYFDRLIPAADRAGLAPFVIAVGPRAAFRRRGVRERLAEWLRLPGSAGYDVHINRYLTGRVRRDVVTATRQVRDVWRRLRGSPGIHEAFSHRGVAFVDLAEADLAGTLLLQLPWAVRSYEEMASALEVIRPRALCLYAESSGWGRAALAACRAAGVPTVAIQHGIIYPKYYSYLHRPDEADCPRPDRTAVFGEAARRFLVEEGGYRPETLVPTGSPKFDDLLAAARGWDRDALRTRLRIASDEKLLLVASRYRGIRRTHQSIGSAFPALLRAVESLPNVQCLVKPHPAEPPDAYLARIREAGARRVRVVPPAADLTELLCAADALVSVESLSAVEALVLARPVLILNMPTNLRAMVEQDVALGVREGEDPTDAVRRLLFDPATRARLEAARGRYLSDLALGVDGRATDRILDLLRETAGDGGSL